MLESGLWFLLPSPAWAEGTVLSLCVCVCVSVCLSRLLNQGKGTILLQT